jgi:hypothetical protein
MHWKSSHELRGVLSDLREWIKRWSMLRLERGATGAAKATTGSIFVEAAAAPCTHALQATPGQRTNAPNVQQVREQLTAHALSARRSEERLC